MIAMREATVVLIVLLTVRHYYTHALVLFVLGWSIHKSLDEARLLVLVLICNSQSH